jgi:hypothetical protein
MFTARRIAWGLLVAFMSSSTAHYWVDKAHQSLAEEGRSMLPPRQVITAPLEPQEPLLYELALYEMPAAPLEPYDLLVPALQDDPCALLKTAHMEENYGIRW